MSPSSLTSARRAPENAIYGKAVRYGRSGWLKVIKVGASRKFICHLILLVFYRKCGDACILSFPI